MSVDSVGFLWAKSDVLLKLSLCQQEWWCEIHSFEPVFARNDILGDPPVQLVEIRLDAFEEVQTFAVSTLLISDGRDGVLQ